uniref:Mediator of RNA polymerase II transcription subunit 30 n=1 Tax=Salmo trutta TaxID=8032 RepID=A0A674A958_SALTR
MAIPLLQKGLGLAVILPQQQQYHLPLGSGSGPVQLPMPPQREISRDIVTHTMEIFQTTRATQLPNGVTQSQTHLHQLALLFRKLRLLYDRGVEMTSDLQEELPEVGLNSISVYKVRQKNQEIKILDQMRNVRRQRLADTQEITPLMTSPPPANPLSLHFTMPSH